MAFHGTNLSWIEGRVFRPPASELGRYVYGRTMKKSEDSSNRLTSWGNSLLNKLSSVTRNKRKRDASKRRRKRAEKDIQKRTND